MKFGRLAHGTLCTLGQPPRSVASGGRALDCRLENSGSQGAISDIFDTDLQHSQSGLLCQSQLFGVTRVGVVPMVVQPLLQNLDRVLRKVASPAPGSGSPASALL